MVNDIYIIEWELIIWYFRQKQLEREDKHIVTDVCKPIKMSRRKWVYRSPDQNLHSLISVEIGNRLKLGEAINSTDDGWLIGYDPQEREMSEITFISYHISRLTPFSMRDR
jgi:hypothetical protein